MNWLLDTLFWLGLAFLTTLLIILYRQLIISSSKDKKVRLMVQLLAIAVLVLFIVSLIKQIKA